MWTTFHQLFADYRLPSLIHVLEQGHLNTIQLELGRWFLPEKD